MKHLVIQNEKDERLLIRLDNWGDGVDEDNRRWVLQIDRVLHVDCWICIETGEVARPVKKRWSDFFARGPRLDQILTTASEEQQTH